MIVEKEMHKVSPECIKRYPILEMFCNTMGHSLLPTLLEGLIVGVMGSERISL